VGKKKKHRRHTSLSEHRKVGSLLIPPLADTNLTPLVWDRDWLPEYLWIASLRQLCPVDQLFKPYYTFMDAIAGFWQDKSIRLGLISDFCYLRSNASELMVQHGTLVRDLFLEPIGRMLAFFPESPASWLVSEAFINEGGHLDPDKELGTLRDLIVDLLDGQGELATAVRMAVFGRMLKSGRFVFPRDMPTLDLLPKYPDQCSPEERALVESFARAAMNAVFISDDNYGDRQWPRYFWRHNFDLTPCKAKSIPLAGSKPVTKDQYESLTERLAKNAIAARDYLDSLAQRLKYDLYEPERGEILHGLFARCVRLYLLVLENPPLWARDTTGIFLRCLVDSAITFCFLATKGSEEDFCKFRQYGEAQKKLLMLHLQDSTIGDTSIEGRAASDISEELGGFAAEMIQIDLGHWSKQDARKLAQAAGLEDYYRLVFSPTSADVHGTWASLKDSNLAICIEPLHRFHRLPTYAEPPLYLDAMQAVQSLLLRAYDTAVSALNYPPELQLAPLLAAVNVQHEIKDEAG
jgi:hypothetical protein